MDTYNLKIFLHAARTLNFTKTAQDMYITQPVVSRRISDLESELGCSLFVRNRRGVSLTTEGEILASSAGTFIKALDEGISKINQHIRFRSNSISIGALPPATLSFLPSIINEFSHKYPELKIDVTALSPKTILEEIESNASTYDILFGDRNDLATGSSMTVNLLFESPYELIMRQEQTCNNINDAINLLRNSSIFVSSPDESPKAYGVALRVLDNIDPELRKNIKLGSNASAFFNLTSGLGVAIMPTGNELLKSLGLKSIPMGISERSALGVAYRKDSSKTIKEFVQLVKDRLSN